MLLGLFCVNGSSLLRSVKDQISALCTHCLGLCGCGYTLSQLAEVIHGTANVFAQTVAAKSVSVSEAGSS